MICPNCSTHMSDDSAFCGNCGRSLQSSQPQAAAPVRTTAEASAPTGRMSIFEMAKRNLAAVPEGSTFPTPSAEPAKTKEKTDAASAANVISSTTITDAEGRTVIVNTVAVKQSNGLGTAGFVFALLSLLVSWAPVVGWIVWLLGLALSVAGLRRKPNGLAIAGTVLSCIDFIVIAVAGSMLFALVTSLI